jgi:hypothetical protein
LSQKWEPVLRPDMRQNKDLVQDDDLKESDLAPEGSLQHDFP